MKLYLLIGALVWAQQSADLLRRAAEHLRARRLEAAISDLTQAAGRDPASAIVHLMLGQAYLGKGSAEFVAQAKAEFQHARDLDESQVLASFYIAKIDLDLGRVQQAERELKRALEKKPGEHYLLALRGETRRQQGDLEGAIELTTRALSAGREAAPVYYYRALAWRDRGDDRRALEDLGRLLGTEMETVDALLLAGAIQLRANREREAETLFRRALEREPERAETHLRLAQVLRKQRRLDAALKELVRVEAAPQLSSPYFQKLLGEAACEQGLVRLERGEAAAARAWFRRALEIDPANAEAAGRMKP